LACFAFERRNPAFFLAIPASPSADALELDVRSHESIEKLNPVQESAQCGLIGKRTRQYR
jgi:hypothetical protein